MSINQDRAIQLVETAKALPSYKLRQAREEVLQDFAQKLGKSPKDWTHIDVISFAQNYADNHKNNKKAWMSSTPSF